MLGQAHSRVDRLSGGERQRVGIARALTQEPQLLLADEPVASLDPANAEQVLALLRRICREDGLTAAMSLHQVNYARKFADRVIGLRVGRVIFDGPPGALTQDVLDEIYEGTESSSRRVAAEDRGSGASEAPIKEAL
jgi:phosphonate transport system ATP-binding protein